MYKPKPMFYVLLVTIIVWWCIFQFGLFQFVIWSLVIGAVLGIIAKMYEQRY
jgi:hypothetical protein